MPKDSLKDKLDGNELDLSLNNLEVVPVKELAVLPKATHLDLSCNLIVKLPDSFSSLTHLVKIDLSKNRLVELPQDFGRLISLQHLDLLGNELKTLPESFSQLRKLKWLDLKDNPLEQGLLKNAGDCLDEKQCRDCAVRILLYMKEYSAQMERKRQQMLKTQRDLEAKAKALEEEKMKRQRELKKTEKEQKKREQQSRKVQQNKLNHRDNDQHSRGDAASTSKKKESKKDKTGRGFWTCFGMIASILLLAVAVLAYLVYRCSSGIKDPICQDYFSPAKNQTLHLVVRVQQEAGKVLSLVCQQCCGLWEVACTKGMEWYSVVEEAVHKAYLSVLELLSTSQPGHQQSQEAGKT